MSGAALESRGGDLAVCSSANHASYTTVSSSEVSPLTGVAALGVAGSAGWTAFSAEEEGGDAHACCASGLKPQASGSSF